MYQLEIEITHSHQFSISIYAIHLFHILGSVDELIIFSYSFTYEFDNYDGDAFLTTLMCFGFTNVKPTKEIQTLHW